MQNDTIKIGICDDSKADIDYLLLLVKSWGLNRILDIETFPSAEAFVFHYEERKGF